MRFLQPPYQIRSLLFLAFLPFFSFGQYIIQGTVIDKNLNESLIGASVVLKGTTTGTVTDVNGRFELKVPSPPPFTLTISFMGYSAKDVEVKSLSDKIKVQLATDEVLLQTVEVTGQRISDKQKENPLTVESMDIIAIKETSSSNFYEGLGQLKGVDMVSASLGFKIINWGIYFLPLSFLPLWDGISEQSNGV